MPRNRKRFKRLGDAVKALGGQQPTAGTPAAFYFDYLTGKPGSGAKKQSGNELPDNARLMGRTSLIPFGVQVGAAAADDDYRIIEISAFANSSATKLSLSDAVLGLTDGKIDVATDDSGFYPAQAIISFARTGANAINNKIGGFSGRTYKYPNNRSSAIPFGRVTTALAEDLVARQKAITSSAQGALGFSFLDEKWVASGRASRKRTDLPNVTV